MSESAADARRRARPASSCPFSTFAREEVADARRAPARPARPSPRGRPCRRRPRRRAARCRRPSRRGRRRHTVRISLMDASLRCQRRMRAPRGRFAFATNRCRAVAEQAAEALDRGPRGEPRGASSPCSSPGSSRYGWSAARQHRQERDWSQTFPGTVEPDEEEAVAAADLVLDPGDGESEYRRCPRRGRCAPDGRGSPGRPGGRTPQLAGELDPRVAGALELLEQEPEARRTARTDFLGWKAVVSVEPSSPARKPCAGSDTSGRGRAEAGDLAAAAPGTRRCPASRSIGSGS